MDPAMGDFISEEISDARVGGSTVRDGRDRARRNQSLGYPDSRSWVLQLFQAMLDSRTNYSCGYWKGAKSLEEAQVNKLELVCQKLILKPGMRLLDIGCGWGALAKYAAQHHGAKVLSITLSLPQKLYAEEFDRVVSIGMFEHVGHKNARTFLNIVRNHLTEDGNFIDHWPRLKARFDQRFFRMWSYYLLSCAGAFRARSLQLWQVVMTKHGLKGGFPIRDLQAEPRPSNAASPGPAAAVGDLAGMGW